MIKFQQLYEELKREGHNQFILNRLEKIDSEFNYERASDTNVFRTASETEVNLDIYKVQVKKLGIEFKNHAEQNHFNDHITKLVNHIKENSEYKIMYEQLDPELVQQLNQVNNDYLRAFHKNHFIDFHNFGLYLTKQSMAKDMDATKVVGSKMGYDFNV